MTPIRTLAISLLFSLSAGVVAADELRIFYAEAPGIAVADIPAASGVQKGSQRSTLDFQAFGRRFQIELQSNERLLGSLARAKQTELSRYSLYRGQLAGLPGSWVRLLKDGDELRGAIWDGYELYTIESARHVTPFLSMSLSVSGDTPVIYRLSDTDSGIGTDFCSVTAGDEAPSALQKFQALTAELETNEALSGITRRIEVAAIADHDFYHDNGEDSESALLARMNIVDGIFSEAVGLTIAVTEVRILTDSNDSLDSDDAESLLEELGGYRSRSSALRATGLTHLVTGRNLTGQTVGIAYVGSLCESRNSVSLSEGRHDVTYSALIAAHEIGHNFGAPHDNEPGSACADTPATFLMAGQINGSREFSQCSVQQMQPLLTSSCIDIIEEAGSEEGGGTTAPPPAGNPASSRGGGGSLDWLLLLAGLCFLTGRRSAIAIIRG